jgi:excisionase family DNA binding protein
MYMNAEERADNENPEERPEVDEAPSQRARALRDEILGSALTLDEAAYVLSLDRTTVAKYLREQTLFGFQIGREWRIPEQDLRAYVGRTIERQRRVIAGETMVIEGELPRSRGFFERVRDDLFQERRKPGKGEDSSRFDKFTTRARRVLALAQEEATRFNHNYIGTEHLLLGLIAEGEGVAARVLTSLGADLDQTRGRVMQVIGRGDRPVAGEVGLTPRAKKVIELAVDEARRLNHHYIGTEHLLLGLLREGEGIAAGVLESIDLNLDRVRKQTLAVLQRTTRSDESSAPPPAPPEATALLPDDTQGIACLRCDARSPIYFRFCFNCGTRLAPHDPHE